MAGRITIEWIADQAELPVGLVKFVMNGGWPELLRRLIHRRYMDEERKTVVKIEAKRARRRAKPRKPL